MGDLNPVNVTVETPNTNDAEALESGTLRSLPEMPSTNLGVEIHGEIVWDFDPNELIFRKKIGSGTTSDVR
jgi:hypothetical protein